MDFFFDYILPWILLYLLLQFLSIPGALVNFITRK